MSWDLQRKPLENVGEASPPLASRLPHTAKTVRQTPAVNSNEQAKQSMRMSEPGEGRWDSYRISETEPTKRFKEE